jgi:hypothetical protein
MTLPPRRLALLAVVTVVTMLLTACAPNQSSQPPSPSAAASSAAIASASASAPPPSASVAPSSGAGSPSSSECAVEPQDGLLPSDRVVSVEVSTSPTTDFVTFSFDAGSLTPAGPPKGELTVAEPPFTFGPSGLPIDLQGQHALQVRFSGMSLSNDAGEQTFTGDPDIHADMPALKQVVMYDESEGIAAWYIGYDGTGCVTLVRDRLEVVVAIAHS